MVSMEHEHKFLVSDPSILDGLEGTSIVQGYFPTSTLGCSLRVRQYPTIASEPTDDNRQLSVGSGATFTMTVKGARVGVSRPEEEIAVPAAFGELAMACCKGTLLDKTRYSVVADVSGDGDRCWDIDVFHGLNSGLVLAELEKGRPADKFEIPEWCGAEVTDDPRYYNDYLATHPFSLWPGQA